MQQSGRIGFWDIVLYAAAMAPSSDAPDPVAATAKLLFASAALILSGAVVYWLRRPRSGVAA